MNNQVKNILKTCYVLIVITAILDIVYSGNGDYGQILPTFFKMYNFYLFIAIIFAVVILNIYKAVLKSQGLPMEQAKFINNNENKE